MLRGAQDPDETFVPDRLAATLQSDGTGMVETKHQSLQRSLLMRDHGCPHQQVRSFPYRLRSTRSCEILHSSMMEALGSYKTLDVDRPRWPHTNHRYHYVDGIRVVDLDTSVIAANDVFRKTKHGLHRSSSGSVTFSQTHRMKVELDADFLAQILGGQCPGGGLPAQTATWTPRRLEWIFKERTGRSGCWIDYDIGIKAFLLVFPKTFELIGPDCQYVQLRRKISTTVVDNIDDVMIRLAQARHGEGLSRASGTPVRSAVVLPGLDVHRIKVVYSPYPEKESSKKSDIKNSSFEDY